MKDFKSDPKIGRELLQLRSRFSSWNKTTKSMKRCLHAMELYALCQDMHKQGHQSWSSTTLQLKKDYYAPHLMEITKVIVSACDICKRYALRTKKLVELVSRSSPFCSSFHGFYWTFGPESIRKSLHSTLGGSQHSAGCGSSFT